MVLTALFKLFTYCMGLSDSIKDELAVHDETQSLKELNTLTICLDNWLCERQIDRMGRMEYSLQLRTNPKVNCPTSVLEAAPSKATTALGSHLLPTQFLRADAFLQNVAVKRIPIVASTAVSLVIS